MPLQVKTFVQTAGGYSDLERAVDDLDEAMQEYLQDQRHLRPEDIRTEDTVAQLDGEMVILRRVEAYF